MGTESKDKRDVYYFMAKKEGYRARSAYKLIDINESFKIFKNIKNVIDLCAAPGSWSQVLRKETNGKILSIDIQDIMDIKGVKILKEDITSEECLKKIIEYFKGELIDLIVSDGAPDVTGFHEIDEYLQMDILKSSLRVAVKIGKIGSIFVGKCFRGQYTKFLVRHFKNFYEEVKLVKPISSRSISKECFILCKGMKVNDCNPLKINISGNPEEISIIGCGKGPHSDFLNNLI